jgi:hypothetical protein
MSKYGMPYMGSKDKIAASLAMNFPPAEHFYDLFGGGFSITHYMASKKSTKYTYFHFNEIKTDVVELIKKAIAGDFNYTHFKPDWISRERFHRDKEFDAYIRFLWSFGNNQTTYLYGPDIEPYKKSMHMAVVFNEFDDLAEKTFRFNKWPSQAKTIYQKRMYLRQLIEHYRKTKIPPHLHEFLPSKNLKRLPQIEQMERLGQLQVFQELERLERLKQLQHLEGLERMKRFQRLEGLHHLNTLNFYSKDYREIPIKPHSIVYCDIPYQGTADYQGKFSHKEFFDWASSRQFPVFISEYHISDPRFQLVYSVDKRSLLSPNKNVDNKSEKLYWNRIAHL